jgi:hypothetical protein
MNFSKKILVAILVATVGFLLTGLISCKAETGGTIVVKTTTQPEWVSISDDRYNLISGTILLYANESREYVVHDDGSYWVCTGGSINYKPFRKVSVSGGETVTVTLE